MGSKSTVLFAIVLVLLVGCRQQPAPANGAADPAAQTPPPAAQNVSTPPREAEPAAPCAESLNWTLEQAVANLAGEETAVCAAIRLVQLQADATYLAEAEERTDLVPVLKLASLDETRVVLGIVDVAHQGQYWAPWLISKDGTVAPVGDPNAGPNLVRISSDPTVFPNLIVTPERVLAANPADNDSLIELEADQPVRFTIRYQDEWPYVALVLSSDPEVEAARYRWMPYELMFHGPVYDDLPEPAEGAFHVNLDASDGLEPVGGKIPPPIEPGAQPGQQQQKDVLPI